MNVPPPLRGLLWPLSLLYGAGVRARVWLYANGWLKQKRLNATVISVGNLTVGGTGKTPMVIWLAEKFLADGKRVAILSRGYRGANGTSDEIELMKFRLQGRVSFGVGKNRFAEGLRLESRQSIDVFLLDDGFQHLQLARDLNILLMDASRPLAGEFLLPAGRLREPIAAMSRANLIIFTRAEMGSGTLEAIAKLDRSPKRHLERSRQSGSSIGIRFSLRRRDCLDSAVSAARALLSPPMKSAPALFLHSAVSVTQTRSSAISEVGGLPFAARPSFLIITFIPSRTSWRSCEQGSGPARTCL